MNGSNYNSIKEMKAAEDEIFGSENKRSKVMIRVLEPFPNYSDSAFPDKIDYFVETYFKQHRIIMSRGKEIKKPSFKINILHYLAYGPVEKTELKRDYISTSELFYIKLSYPEDIGEQIEKAFLALSRFGALGSRSRNGYGCFKINEFDNDFTNTIILDDFKIGNKQKFTTFSKDIIYYQSDIKGSWHEALADIGKKYQKARQTVERWRTYDKRILLTQPITNANENNTSPILKEGRHSKPYFLHVEKIADEQFKGQILCLPYEYLEEHPTFSGQYKTKYNQAINDFNQKLGI
jgi:CRISPR-associated protein Cmr1